MNHPEFSDKSLHYISLKMGLVLCNHKEVENHRGGGVGGMSPGIEEAIIRLLKKMDAWYTKLLANHRWDS